MLNEFISHLERQPRNKDRRIAWLKYADSLFNGVGVVLLAHFRRIFPLFFQWMHADDDETITLPISRGILNFEVTELNLGFPLKWQNGLVDELAVVYKEAALRTAREDIRANICQILILLQESKGLHFDAAWDKHRSDPDLTTLNLSLSRRSNTKTVPSEDCLQQGSVPVQ
ncbi:hypothetical protein V8G54_020353 [Vigna mungo]|uniref:Uncharacterized protein n=1 Tax=Vigna mungo TaxID=3915 RepID=A0AAQ3RUM5_VIGMU